MFDSHCHLTDIDEPERALTGALAAGLASLLTCGVNARTNRAVLALRDAWPGLPFALGLHPWHADEEVGEVLRQIEAEHPVAVGEAGLDFWSDPPIHPRERQYVALEAQLDLAARLDLPVTLHSRKAVNELLPVLRNHPRVRGALHAFSGSLEQAASFVRLGYLIGIGGGVTRERARRVRRMAKELPLDSLLLETDAPAIGMDVVEPPSVRPQHVRRVAEVLAQLRGVEVDEIEAQTDANARALFGVEAFALASVDRGG